jgi:hypothetical protein
VAQYNAILANKELVRKAQLVRSSLDWESCDMDQGKETAESAGLPGATAARAYMEEVFATDRQGFVILVKLTILQMIEDRYGLEVAAEYVNRAIRALQPGTGSIDRLFSWNRDVLMLVVRRAMSPMAMRMEGARLMQNSHEFITELNGKRS